MDFIGLLAYQDVVRRSAVNRHTMTSAQQEEAFYAFYAEPLWPRLNRLISRSVGRLLTSRCQPTVIADEGKPKDLPQP